MAKSLRGEIEFELGGEKYTLRLGLGELEEIENATGLGTLEVLRGFGTNAKISHATTILCQALTVGGKKLPAAKVRAIIEKAGFRECVSACVSVMTAVLMDPEGNADAAGQTADPAA